MRKQSPDVRVLVELNRRLNSLIVSAGWDDKERIDERAVPDLLLWRLLRKDHADAGSVRSHRAVCRVVHLKGEHRAGLDAHRGAGLEGHRVSAGSSRGDQRAGQPLLSTTMSVAEASQIRHHLNEGW